MPVEVIMPKVDMDMATGRIAAWHVAEGAAVTKGAPLFDIETDKAAMEVEAPADGVLHHVAVAAGAEVPIGTAVAWIYAAGEIVGPAPTAGAEAPGADLAAAMPQRDPTADAGRPAPQPDPGLAHADGHRPRATPKARDLARAAGVALADVAGSGPRGRVQAIDVLARAPAAEQAPGEAPVTEGGALSVIRRGGGARRPVVVFHGFAADWTAWTPVLPALTDDREAIMIELPGHGQSPRSAISDFPALLRQVRAAFDGLDIDSAHLVGHSLGGALALALADTRPRKLASLTLLCPAGLGPKIDGTILDGILRATRAESLAPWLRRLPAAPDAVTGAYVAAAMQARRDPALRAAQAQMAAALFPDGTQGFDLTAALDRLACPARILWGKRDPVIPWRHALRAPGRVALHLFDAMGHLPHLEDPEAVGVVLRDLP